MPEIKQVHKLAEAPNPGTLKIWGDGKQTRSFCYVTDCVEGIYRLMHSDYHESINLGQDRMVTIDEVVNIVARIAGKKITVRYDLSKPQGVRGRNADIRVARDVLGWEPKVSLEEGLKNTYKWIKSQL